MSKSTSVLCNHTLDTSNVENLAKDLSKRLKATITFGYNYTFFVNNENELDYDLEFIEIGTIPFSNTKLTYQLVDIKLGQKEFVKTNSLEILDSENIKIDEYLKERLLEDIVSVEYELCENDGGEYDTICYIFEKCSDLWIEESLSWHYFQRLFIYKVEQEDLDYINLWRSKNKKWVNAMGGNYMFVYSLEEKSNKVFEWLQVDTLPNLVEKIETEFKNSLVNISTYIGLKEYSNKPVFIQEYNTPESLKRLMYAMKHDINLHPFETNYPILFYDDFKDLDSSLQHVPLYFNLIFDGSSLIQNLKKNDLYQKNILIERDRKELSISNNYFKLYCCYVSGFKHYTFVDLELNLILNQEVFLEREPQNVHDKHAIAIYIDYQDSIEESFYRRKIGYISRSENYMLSKLLDNVLTPIKQEYYSKFRLLIMRLIFSLKLDVYPGSISLLV